MTARPQPAWIRLLIPSVTDLIFVVLLVSLSYCLLSQRLLGDAGTGWHIRNGQQILSTHVIPRTDSFSSTMGGKRWYAWEWFYDLGIGFIHNRAGLNGVVFISALLIALTFTFLFRLLLRRGTDLLTALLFFLLAASASTIHFLARPHVLSWLFALVWLRTLDSSETGMCYEDWRYRNLYWFPVLMLVWVNLHGGFLLGFVLLGIYLLAAAIERFTSKDLEARTAAGQWARLLGSISGLCLLASFVNPYGYKLHGHVYAYLSNQFLMDHIEEFQSPNFHSAAPKCFAALLLIALSILAVGRRMPKLSHVFLLLFATYAGLYASRNIPIASMLIAVVVAPLLSAWIGDPAQGQESRWQRLRLRISSFAASMGHVESRLRGHLWPAIVVLASLWICVHQGRVGSRQLMKAGFDETRFPVHAVDLILKRGIHEPVFSLDSWGGFLIYRCPQAKVVVDDRHDLYGEQFLKEYLKVVHVQPEWEKILDGWNVNWILLPANSALSSILKQTPHWTIIRDDGVAILFHREAGTGPSSHLGLKSAIRNRKSSILPLLRIYVESQNRGDFDGLLVANGGPKLPSG